MGGGGSKQELQSEVVTEIMSKVCARSVQNCTTTSLVNQELVISGVRNSKISGINMSQSYKVTINCKVTNQSVAELQDNIASELSKGSSQTTQAVLGAINAMAGEKNSAISKTNIKNVLSRDITTETIQNIINSFNSSQRLVISNVSDSTVQDITLTQAVDAVQEAFNEGMSNTKLVAAIRNQEETSLKADQRNPIADTITSVGGAVKDVTSGVSDILSGMNMTFLIIAVIIIVVIWRFGGVIGSVVMNYSPVGLASKVFGKKK